MNSKIDAFKKSVKSERPETYYDMHKGCYWVTLKGNWVKMNEQQLQRVLRNCGFGRKK